MVGTGLASTTSEVTFTRTATPLNAANYDGTCVYEFEIVAINSNATNAYDISLYDATNAAVKATVSVTKDTTSTRYRSAPFSPAAGNNIYQVRIAASEAANDIKVYLARIVVTQTAATKTRIQVPLVANAYGTTSNSDGYLTDFSAGASYTQGNPGRYAYWKRDDAAWGTVSGYALEAVLSTNDASGTAYAILNNVTDAADVTESEVHSHSNGAYELVTQSLTSAGNFHDGDTYQLLIKGTGTYQGWLAMASVYLTVAGMSKGECYWLVGRSIVAGTAGVDLFTGRAKADLSLYSSPVLCHEATVLEATAGEAKLHLHEEGTSDSATAHAADLTNSTLTPGTTKGIVRSAALSGVTDGDRIWARKDASTYNITLSSMWLVVAWTGSEPPPPDLTSLIAFGIC